MGTRIFPCHGCPLKNGCQQHGGFVRQVRMTNRRTSHDQADRAGDGVGGYSPERHD